MRVVIRFSFPAALSTFSTRSSLFVQAGGAITLRRVNSTGNMCAIKIRAFGGRRRSRPTRRLFDARGTLPDCHEIFISFSPESRCPAVRVRGVVISNALGSE
ncbi:hypothetical protein SCHPADRAFT_316993 [Schizopora paradoxa]|uniref:Uncharacterized protein n=1 Tax=Schizopora paradoxa TaxID=27342 RepID=A0A0H2SC13_9AGAM|nr:hypothetical protein SCHPADRAFT_316993 [Schizopora paradoxa]